ncbi:hypothetical protein FOHLNKBM_4198 [Methylobacterium longum]|nr:hypothetical protein FOHLNKBM_4198 [Methylobacterium longum]
MGSKLVAPKMTAPDLKPSRVEVIRQILTEYLKAKGYLE